MNFVLFYFNFLRIDISLSICFKVWFKNRRAKYRKKQVTCEQTSSQTSEKSSKNNPNGPDKEETDSKEKNDYSESDASDIDV